MTYLLHRPCKERLNPKEGDFDGLKKGNFLSFAIACRWIKRLVYVHHPKIEWKNVDIGRALFKNFDKNSKIIQLKKISTEEFQRYMDRDTCSPKALEPEVPLAFVNHTEFKAQKIFTYVFFTHSPEYTPSKADFLIPIIREYINEAWYLN